MYILKNAFRSIQRSKGRNILIGIIVLVIAISACVSLSIQEAADNVKEKSQKNLEVTAQISLNRKKMMENQEDREAMKNAMVNMQELSLEEMQTYAEAESVKSFYYTATTSLDAGDGLEAIDTTGNSDTASEDTEGQSMMPEDGKQSAPGGGPSGGRMGTQGDFTVIGYSSDEAMTAFLDGTASITEGEMFAENTENYDCVISEELATYNELKAGDSITLANPNNVEETYVLTIVGIYRNEEGNQSPEGMMGGFSAASDPANQIYMSYTAVHNMVATSEASAEVETDETTGMERSTAIKEQLQGTYTFQTVEDYEKFPGEAQKLGLSEEYSISSTDVEMYEQSMEPLENLSEYAKYFFVVVLIIGGIILSVLNIFNIRERKYEIGVLAAIGMKKWKIAVQFSAELLCVTFLSLIVGTAAGAVSSVPITNKLLEKQIESQTEQQTEQMGNFGRERNMPGEMGQPMENQNGKTLEQGESTGNQPRLPEIVSNYVSQVDSATNIHVLIQLVGVGILLTVLSSVVAIAFVLRYDPLKILANRE